MCNLTCLEFVKSQLTREEVAGKSIIEVGSRVVNFSPRPILEALEPASYVGIDFANGPSVDEICDAEDMVERFGKESFDITISTELLEHVRNWRKVVSNLKNITRRGGRLLLTTRSKGFDYHGFPHDFWRYELSDMKTIFSDFHIEAITNDPATPGVFLKAVKPQDFSEKDLANYRLYSVVSRRRILAVTKLELALVKTVIPLIMLVKNVCVRTLPKPVKKMVRDKILGRLS